MKLVAHRGWSAGPEENTLAAFARAAGDSRIAGVELDLRRAADGRGLAVAHDPPLPGAPVLALEEALAHLGRTRLELFIEVKEAGLAPDVIDALVAGGLADRAVVFAFAGVARSFPWQRPRKARLGTIVVEPWRVAGAMRTQRPDMLFLGWDYRAWTRLAFRSWWTIASLDRLAGRYQIPVVAGIVHHAADLRWLARQGLYAAVADFGPSGIDRI